jgi:hypothetical protein
MSDEDPDDGIGAYVSRCVRHALSTLAPPFPGGRLTADDCDVALWKQSWPNTACGWPGIAGQAFTSAYTVVVVGPHGDAVVYLGRPAYRLPSPADVSDEKRAAFYEAVSQRRMPRVVDCGAIGCKRIPMESL